jgi:2-polyprenyl-6-methoxyphenol hydroxylase-like FAD-dependent oxidoreductase
VEEKEREKARNVSVKWSDLSRPIFAKIADDCEVLFGDTVKPIDQGQDGTRVSFERGKERRFDLVIGADGLHSAVRRIAFGPQENYEKLLGYTVAAFEVSGYRPRDEDVYVIHEQPGRQIGRFALRGDRTFFLFVLAHDVEEISYPKDASTQKALLRNAFAALDSCTELYFDRVSQIKMDAWSRGRIAGSVVSVPQTRVLLARPQENRCTGGVIGEDSNHGPGCFIDGARFAGVLHGR